MILFYEKDETGDAVVDAVLERIGFPPNAAEVVIYTPEGSAVYDRPAGLEIYKVLEEALGRQGLVIVRGK